MNIFAIIPVHNRKEYTRGCLVSLQKQTYQDFTTVVVDDGSVDGTSEMIQSEFGEVIVLRGDGNLWWTGSINLGISYALKNNADYVITLNDDTIIPDFFLESMVNWAKQKPQAVMGALEKDIHTQQNLYAGQMEKWGVDRSIKIIDSLSDRNISGIRRVDTFHGRGLWLPKSVFEEIGLFDDKRFPHYMADFDFVYNAHKNGFEVYCNLDAYLYSYPEACGDKANKVKKNFINFYEHLFGTKGGGNMTNFTRYTFKHCPPHLIPLRLLLGYSRRVVGYWVN